MAIDFSGYAEAYGGTPSAHLLGQGIGQFAQPDYDALDQQSYTQDLGGGEFTDSMGNVDYSDPYDPGGGE